MRLGIVVMVMAMAWPARGDDLAKYAGQVVISRDPVPLSAGDLPKWLAENATNDHHYELIKTWTINLAAVLTKDPGERQVTLVVVEKVDPPPKRTKPKDDTKDKPTEVKPPEPLISIELSAKRKIVAAHATATPAAGFAAGKLYAVQVMLDHAVLASADLTLRN